LLNGDAGAQKRKFVARAIPPRRKKDPPKKTRAAPVLSKSAARKTTIELPTLPQDPAQSSFWRGLHPRAREFLAAQGATNEALPPEQRPRRERRLDEHVAQRERRRVREAARMPSGRGRRRELAERRRRAEERDRRYLERLRARLRERGLEQREPPRLIPRRVWVLAQDVLADPSGRAVRIWMSRARNKVAVGAIRLAALVPGPAGSRYSWADERARRIAALGLGLLELGAPTARRGIWTDVVRGVTRGALCALLANPWERERRPSMTALAGRHRSGADFTTGQVGYLRALEEAGFCYRQQLPADDRSVRGFERWRGKEGDVWTSNRYWIVSLIPTRALSDEEKRRLIALNEAGWDAPDEEISRAPERRGRGLRFAEMALAQPP
jgi:hypothetical protein